MNQKLGNILKVMVDGAEKYLIDSNTRRKLHVGSTICLADGSTAFVQSASVKVFTDGLQHLVLGIRYIRGVGKSGVIEKEILLEETFCEVVHELPNAAFISPTPRKMYALYDSEMRPICRGSLETLDGQDYVVEDYGVLDDEYDEDEDDNSKSKHASGDIVRVRSVTDNSIWEFKPSQMDMELRAVPLNHENRLQWRTLNRLFTYDSEVSTARLEEPLPVVDAVFHVHLEINNAVLLKEYFDSSRMPRISSLNWMFKNGPTKETLIAAIQKDFTLKGVAEVLKVPIEDFVKALVSLIETCNVPKVEPQLGNLVRMCCSARTADGIIQDYAAIMVCYKQVF